MEAENQLDRPLGMEVRLTDIPSDMPAAVIKAALADQYLNGIQHNFLVIFEQSAEEFFWDSFDAAGVRRTRSARLIIPNDLHGDNAGADLIDRAIVVRD